MIWGQRQYTVKALDDHKKVTFFTALCLRQYLTDDFDMKGTLSQEYKISCAEILNMLLKKKIK